MTPLIDLELRIGPVPGRSDEYVAGLRDYFTEYRPRYDADSWGARHFEQGDAERLELVPRVVSATATHPREAWRRLQGDWVAYLEDHGRELEAWRFRRALQLGVGVCPACGGSAVWRPLDPAPRCVSAGCEPDAITAALPS